MCPRDFKSFSIISFKISKLKNKYRRIFPAKYVKTTLKITVKIVEVKILPGKWCGAPIAIF